MRMEQANWMNEEGESVIWRNIFLGLGYGKDEVESKKVTNKFDIWNCRDSMSFI